MTTPTHNYQTLTGPQSRLQRFADDLQRAGLPFEWVTVTRTDRLHFQQEHALNISREVFQKLFTTQEDPTL